MARQKMPKTLEELAAERNRSEKQLHYADIDILESSLEELDAGWEDLCRRIREKYGEDAI